MSTSITVPGGTATFLDPEDITPRRERQLKIYGAQAGPVFRRIIAARKVAMPDGAETDDTLNEDDGDDLELNEREAGLVIDFPRIVAWAYLESWTVRETRAGSAGLHLRPLPATPDDMLDLPRDLFDALVAHGAKLAVNGRVGEDQFVASDTTLTGDPNKETPTGG